MSKLENDVLKEQVLRQLEKAMFHSMTTSELARQLESMPRKVRRAAMDLAAEGKISPLLTNDLGRPEYRYFLLHVPKEEAPVEEPQAPWYRRVLGWFK
jgi:predicted ArsR family transcriptional regulator